MADVIALFRVMPDSAEVDMEALKTEVEKKITYGEFKMEIVPVAFGLNAIDITIKLPGDKGIDPIVDGIGEVQHVASVELQQVGNV